MSHNALILLAMLGSAALLGGALAFQYYGGLHPCHLCLLQRWPHAVAIGIGLVALAMGWPLLTWAGALAAATTAALGIYHTGVERAWWQGPASCTGSIQIHGISAKALLDKIMAAPVVRCDEVAWSFLNLSMASWNAIFSSLLVVLWVAAALRDR